MDPVPVRIEAFGQSDVGHYRDENEDQFLVAHLSRSLEVERTSLSIDDQTRLHGVFQGTLLLVADGMGGEKAGGHASRLAVQTLTTYVLNTMPWFFRLDEKLADDLIQVLREGVSRCEAAIHSYRESTVEGSRMGTTVTLAYILWPNMYLVHAGDSRCYLLRQGQLQQLTRDHTVAQLMADRGQSDPDRDQRYGHVLWNAVGAEPSQPVNPDVTRTCLLFGDTVLLCSDGLHGLVADERIAQILVEGRRLEDACQGLIDEALANGGQDNVTVVMARFAPVEGEDEATVIERAVG
jgi:protein phosphatase